MLCKMKIPRQLLRQTAVQPNVQSNSLQFNGRPLEPADYLKKNIVPEYCPADDSVVDVLTNEVIRKPSRK